MYRLLSRKKQAEANAYLSIYGKAARTVYESFIFGCWQRETSPIILTIRIAMAIVLITGATGGLGRSVTQQFLQMGHTVVAAVRDPQSMPTQEGLHPYTLDVSDEQACRQFVENTVAEHGAIDVAVLLVGGFAMGTLLDTDYAAVEAQLKINFQSAYQVARPVFEQMSQQANGGRIVLIGSRPALDPTAGQHVVAYALSKSLVNSLADLINAAGKKKNVVATVVAPSTIDTPSNRKDMPDADFKTWINPAELAEMIAFVSLGAGKTLREPVLKAYGQA
ncbi:hypothetical protein BWI93_17470 [Siphonobacter sp. BAB-5385]|nr:hypothetical protein BWI93_17470 [Siphonobacter sp. BAB-5385]